MKQVLIALALMGTVTLGGCNQETIQTYKTQMVAVVPPDALYECPAKPQRPVTAKMRDSQVAEYLVRLDRAHSICSKSLQHIKAFADQAKLTIEKNSN